MKSRTKAGIYFGIGAAIVYIVVELISVKPCISDKQVVKIVLAGIVCGIVSGFLFGWIGKGLINSKWIKETTQIDIHPGEKIIFQTAANHFKGIEGVGGKLYLTNKRLIFKSHKMNIQNHELSVNLSDITRVSRYKILGIVNKGIFVVTAQKKTEKFVVENSNDWINHLSRKNNPLQ